MSRHCLAFLQTALGQVTNISWTIPSDFSFLGSIVREMVRNFNNMSESCLNVVYFLCLIDLFFMLNVCCCFVVVFVSRPAQSPARSFLEGGRQWPDPPWAHLEPWARDYIVGPAFDLFSGLMFLLVSYWLFNVIFASLNFKWFTIFVDLNLCFKIVIYVHVNTKCGWRNKFNNASNYICVCVYRWVHLRFRCICRDLHTRRNITTNL